MKMVERIFEQRIRQHIDIDDMQFGFMKCKGTTDAIFIVRQMQEKFTVKGKKLYFGFVPEFIRSNSNSGLHSCISISIMSPE